MAQGIRTVTVIDQRLIDQWHQQPSGLESMEGLDVFRATKPPTQIMASLVINDAALMI